MTRAHPGAVTVIQRASGSMTLNSHLHSLVADGIFVQDQSEGSVSFHPLPAPTDQEVAGVAWDTCRRVRTILIKRGLWKDIPDESEETPPPVPGAGLAEIYSASVRGVLLMGPRRGQRVIRLFGRAAVGSPYEPHAAQATYGFDVHAKQVVPAGARRALERLARYVLRPALSNGRLAPLPNGHVVLRMKRPWRDGTTACVFPPLDFLARLAAVIPRPRTNLIRFHGVFASQAHLRRSAVPAPPPEPPARPCDEPRAPPLCYGERLTWAELLARTFAWDIFRCGRCGGGLVRIAVITDPAAIRKILRGVGLATAGPDPRPPRPLIGNPAAGVP